jgi:hypothetical protein
MKTLFIIIMAGACVALPGCRGAGGGGGGQPDVLEMGREMAGELKTFTLDVKDDVVDRVTDRM